MNINRASDLGRVLFGASMAAFGVQNFIYSEGVFGLEPVPSWMPGRQAWAYVTGLALLASGTAIVLGKRTQSAATVAGVVLGVWTLVLQAPRLVAAPRAGGAWTTAFETLALCGAAWVLATTPTRADAFGGSAPSRLPMPARLGRIAYAGSLPVFGVLHFIYRDYVTSVIPAWIPSPASWTYMTALAFIAASISMLTGLWSRLAAVMLGVMFGIWVLILHLPRMLAVPRSRPEWTSLLIAMAMSGGAWIIATRTPKRK